MYSEQGNWRGMTLFIALVRLALALALALPPAAAITVAAARAAPMRIECVDAATRRGVPLVQLTTSGYVSYYSDSAGVVAFYSGRNRQGVQGAHLNPLTSFLNPLGIFLRASIPFVWCILSAFLRA
jgi:hypothetical protein